MLLKLSFPNDDFDNFSQFQHFLISGYNNKINFFDVIIIYFQFFRSLFLQQ